MSDEPKRELATHHDQECEQAGVVTDAEARKILSRFNASHWKHSRPTGGEVARYSIPADPRRDDDIRLSAYITQAERLRAEVLRLEGERDAAARECARRCDDLNAARAEVTILREALAEVKEELNVSLALDRANDRRVRLERIDRIVVAALSPSPGGPAGEVASGPTKGGDRG